ncbi:hypothetical protein [Streptomyces sp. NPDC048603]|uniref:hypothetical protein n=1 Tax=Streptomyces sp. NPDC048603 TaxID=3365577 RepID=UPI00371D2426
MAIANVQKCPAEPPAGTSGAHLLGAGHFAFVEGLDNTSWLDRTLRTVTINPDIAFPGRVAARAAKAPGHPAARKILPTLVDSLVHAADYRMAGVVQQAQAVLEASEAGSEGRADLGQALARHADDVEAATAE